MPDAHCAINALCAKQPILDAGLKIWGYAFAYHHAPPSGAAEFSDEDKAALQEMAESVHGAAEKGKTNVKICVKFAARSIIDGIPYALPPELAIIEIPDIAAPSDALLSSLKALRKKNYTIALDTVPKVPHAVALARLADVLKVDMLRTTETERGELLALAGETRSMPLATGVATRESFREAQQAGFSLFQGFFFQQTVLQSQRALTSLESTRLRLFRLLQSPEPDFGALGEVIQADVSLSYRLLALLNSPAFKLVRRIESIGQALVLLGWQQLKSWLLVVILTDLMSPGTSPELVINSAQRAKFFELASEKTASPHAPETLFLLGLFSLLEPLMGVPMARIADDLPLDKDIKDALCGQRNACSCWLELAESFEALHWERVLGLLQALGLDTLDAANAYHAATLWANTMLTLF